jgi:cobalt-zinc-cadmium efflux system membrane fusion protein
MITRILFAGKAAGRLAALAAALLAVVGPAPAQEKAPAPPARAEAGLSSVQGETEEQKEHANHQGSRERDDHKAVRLSPEAIKEFGIKTAIAGFGQLNSLLKLNGEIVLNADLVSHIVPRVPGIVSQVRKTLGDKVKAGQVMAVLESRELADAKAAFLAANERESLAAARYRREARLWRKKITSEQEYLDAKQALAEARIMRRSAEQKLHALGFSHGYLKRLPSSPDQTFTRFKITAPIEGTVVKRHISLGEKLGGDSPVFVVADLRQVWANFTVYQKDLARVAEGDKVLVKATHHNLRAWGSVDYVSPILDESTRSATARVVLDNAKGQWRPGMFVTGLVSGGRKAAKVLIPDSAIQMVDGKTVVFLRYEDGFELRPIKTGHRQGGQVEVLAGLEAGQRYVVKGAFTIKAELAKGSFGDGHGH